MCVVPALISWESFLEDIHTIALESYITTSQRYPVSEDCLAENVFYKTLDVAGEHYVTMERVQEWDVIHYETIDEEYLFRKVEEWYFVYGLASTERLVRGGGFSCCN